MMDYNNKPDKYFNNQRLEMLSFLPPKAEKILDIGCGDGSFGLEIKRKIKSEVWGIELDEKSGKIAKKNIDKVFIGECEKIVNDLPDNYFDCIYFNDVLEHLVDPYKVLSDIKYKLSSNGVVISSIPNIRYYKVLKMLLIDKEWEYKKYGILDKTHLRFFTSKSILKMYLDAGYKVTVHRGINRTRSITPYFYNIPFLFTAMDIFYTQFATVARKNFEISKL